MGTGEGIFGISRRSCRSSCYVSNAKRGSPGSRAAIRREMSEAARGGTVLGGLVGHRQGDRGEAKRGRNGDADSGKKGERCLDAGLGRHEAPPWRKPECKLVSANLARHEREAMLERGGGAKKTERERRRSANQGALPCVIEERLN